MITISQRICELRNEKQLSKEELSQSLHFPTKAIDRFESGKQTPNKQQTESMANFFNVSVSYLRGETNDPTRQDSWMDMQYEAEKEIPQAQKPIAKPKPIESETNQSLDMPLLEALLKNEKAKDLIKECILDVLSSKEGQKIIQSIIKK